MSGLETKRYVEVHDRGGIVNLLDKGCCRWSSQEEGKEEDHGEDGSSDGEHSEGWCNRGGWQGHGEMGADKVVSSSYIE